MRVSEGMLHVRYLYSSKYSYWPQLCFMGDNEDVTVVNLTTVVDITAFKMMVSVYLSDAMLRCIITGIVTVLLAVFLASLFILVATSPTSLCHLHLYRYMGYVSVITLAVISMF